MARQFSLAFVGKQIDYIPHTGVYVYGREYFFGGGIQCMKQEEIPLHFGMSPVQRIPLGNTSIDRNTFHTFLRGISHRFTQSTYNFLENNCNNFTNECSNFLVGHDIPISILGLPREFQSTPLGSMIAPMLSNMQDQMTRTFNDGHSGKIIKVKKRERGTFLNRYHTENTVFI